jgi:hypothetical protein
VTATIIRLTDHVDAGLHTRRLPFMSVPEAAIYVLARNPQSRHLVRSVARLTGVSVTELTRIWGGQRELRIAASRYAMTFAFG